jgi:uncharacterized protein YceK
MSLTTAGILTFVVLFTAGCGSLFKSHSPTAATPVLAAGALLPSPRLIVGRVVAVDLPQRFAFVELAADAPSAALVAGTELRARTLELRETGRIQVSPYLRGRTLGTKIVGGQPSPGDEVVWLAP